MKFVTDSLGSGRPLVGELERRPEVVVLFECLPLLAQGEVTGALILLRDVTDVRRLDLLVLSKDAAIREVHHRVKNNLQTISALLRLQSRRLEDSDGKDALLEAERRVRSIALVHEILSRDPGDQVPFDELVGPLVKMAEDSVVVSRPIEISFAGDLGETTADVATPLAVAIAELLQNAVEHGFIGEETDRLGHVFLTLGHRDDDLVVEIRDDGRGLPEGFDLDATPSLGLSLVRDLVRSQLEGEITMETVDVAAGGGTRVTLRIPRHLSATQ
jgi:two-component sensor histidine kinase